MYPWYNFHFHSVLQQAQLEPLCVCPQTSLATWTIKTLSFILHPQGNVHVFVINGHERLQDNDHTQKNNRACLSFFKFWKYPYSQIIIFFFIILFFNRVFFLNHVLQRCTLLVIFFCMSNLFFNLFLCVCFFSSEDCIQILFFISPCPFPISLQ